MPGRSTEVEHLRDITRRGTSTHRQLAVYHAARDKGADEAEALRAVVHMLREDTLIGV